MITADQIKRARERLAESQIEFAVRFGVHQGTVSRWELGRPPKRGPAKKMLEVVIAEAAE